MRKKKNHASSLAIATTILLCIMTAVMLTSCRGNLCANDEALDPEVMKLINDAPSVESYPDADVIYLLDDAKEEIFHDGSYQGTYQLVTKVLKETGKGFADCEIGFNSRMEKITLLHARTITPDGKIIPLEKNAIKIVTPYSSYPAYTDYQQLTFSLPGVEVGSILDYKYSYARNPSIEGKSLGPFFFQSLEPCLISRYELTAPASMKLNYLFRNPLKSTASSPTITIDGDKKIYFWEYSHIPQIFSEDFMPPDGELLPNVMLTAMDSWEEFFSWWQNEVKDKTKADAAIKEKVKALTKGLSCPDEKMAALFDYVKREIRYVSIGMGASGFVPQSAVEVFKNKYGDCKDKSTLLISMLRNAGIKAHYTLIPTAGESDLITDFPHMNQFNHCIVAVENGNGYHYLDPVASEYSYDYLPEMDQNRTVVVFKDGKPVFTRTPLLAAEKNTTLAKLKMDIKPDGTIRADAEYDYSGSNEAVLRSLFMDIGPTEEEEFINEFLNDISPEATLVDYLYSDPHDFKKKFMARISFDAHAYCEKAGDLLIIRLPQDIGAYSVPEMEERRYPIYYHSLDNDVVEVEFNAPEGYEIYHLPERIDLETPHIKFHSGFGTENDKIVYHAQLMDSTVRIPAAEYGEYRKACQIMNKTLERHLIFRKKKA